MKELENRIPFEHAGIRYYYHEHIIEFVKTLKYFPNTPWLMRCADYAVEISTGKVLKNRWGIVR